jgi:hypothetical protein
MVALSDCAFVSTRNTHARGALSYLALLVEVSTTTDTS